MTSEFDVICVGSGAGGMGGAITAAEGGASVVVLEKGPRVGGSTAYSSGQAWYGANRFGREAGYEDSPEETREYLDFLSMGIADPVLRDNFITRAPEALEFLAKCGIELQTVPVPDFYYPEAPGSKAAGRVVESLPFEERRLGDLVDRVDTSPHGDGWVTNTELIEAAGQHESEIHKLVERHMERRERCQGAGLAAQLALAAANRGVEFRTSSPVVRLLFDDGRVQGVVVRDESGEHALRARSGVLLATGGYDHNPAFIKTFEGVEGDGNIPSMAPPGITGDHILLAGQVGGEVVKARFPETNMLEMGFHTPGEDHFGKPKYRYFLGGTPHSIIVNRYGRRYTDDGSPHDAKAAVRQVDPSGDVPNWPSWLIVDQNYRDNFTLGAVPPGEPLPEGMEAVVTDDIRELAEASGIDPDGLEETVERWNGFCERGVDDDFGRGKSAVTLAYAGPNTLAPINKPPYVAIKLSFMNLNMPSAGVRINADAQAVNLAGDVIPGLFVAGNAAAYLDAGARYQSGLGNGRGITYGYVAAGKMAAGTP